MIHGLPAFARHKDKVPQSLLDLPSYLSGRPGIAYGEKLLLSRRPVVIVSAMCASGESTRAEQWGTDFAGVGWRPPRSADVIGLGARTPI